METLSEAVEQAEQLDASGKHEAAYNALIAGARKDDLEAITRLGKRLLIGDRAPRSPDDGVKLLQHALRTGGGEAAARLAVLHALGVCVEQDVARAIELLAVAAERDWRPAQQQLRVLAGQSGETAWQRLAASIDPDRWTSVPERQVINASPLICSHPEFAGHAVCRWLIQKAHGRLTRAEVYDSVAREVTVSATRTNTVASMNLLETDIVTSLVQMRMAACTGIPLRHLEPLTVLHYAEGEEIADHYDFIDPQSGNYELELAQGGQRIITFLIYLNDDYSGGETAFPELNVRHKGRLGEGLFFVNSLEDYSADMRSLHAGRPVASGEKWIVSQFIRRHAVF